MNHNKNNDQLSTELRELQLAYDSLKKIHETELSKHAAVIKAFEESEARYRNLYLYAPINYQSLDADARFIDVNPCWLQTLGYTREEVIGHHFTEFLSPASAALVKTRFPFFIKAGKVRNFEFEIIRKDGTSLIVNFEGTIGLDEKGNFKQTHCVWTDISLRKQAEEANRIKDLAIESSINAIAISDLDGNLTYVNPSFYKLWGYSLPEEVIGKPAVGFWQAGDKAQEVVDALVLKGGWIGELVALSKAGTSFDVQVSASMVKNNEGKPMCMLASFADISGRKIAERLQAENEVSYRELFDNVDDSIYIMDAGSTFLDVNEGAVKMYGYPREVLIGKNPAFVAAPGKNDMEVIASMAKRAFEGEPQLFEFWGMRSNGEVFPKEVRIINGTYFGKKVNIAIAQDITDRKTAEKALQESERKYRELIELAVDGILLGSPEGKIIGANSYMQKLSGRSLEKLIGLDIHELFHKNVLKDVPFRFDLLKSGETVFSERDLLLPDGKFIPVEMHTKMMPDGTYQSIYRDVTDRKKAEETLRESEIKFKSLVESTSDMIWETNLEGKYTYVSPQFENLLGYSPEEAIGTSPFAYIESDNVQEIISESDSIVKKAIPFSSLVNTYTHRDGHILYFETSGVPVFNTDGHHVGYRGVSRDVTKRYLAEKELYKLSSVVHQSPNAIIITNLNGEIEYINPAGCTSSGYSSDELIGNTPAIFKSGAIPSETYTDLWQTIKSGKEWRGVFLNKKKNKDPYWESAFILPLRNAEGIITHYLGIKEDISKRVQAETALKESEERYRALFEASPDAIILADIESGMLMDANAAACSLLGRSIDEIRNLHQTMIHPPRNGNFSAESFMGHAQKAKTSEATQPIESIILRSDGVEIPVEVVSSANSFMGRQVLQGVFRNITERNQAREELLKAKEKAEASDRLKSAFLNNISHELRTPLNGIIGFSEMITQMDNSEDERIEFTKMIRKSSSRLINTISSYIDISTIISGITEINKQPFSLNNFFTKIKNSTTEACHSRNLQLYISNNSQSDDCIIYTDENLLTKIVEQLVDNALKFTRKGSITLGHRVTDAQHEFSVTDTGIGISKESLDKIFEVFMQADLSTSRGYDGSGLGLSIAKGYVQLLGGEIWVESEPGEGTSFYFSIPLKPAASSGSLSNSKQYHAMTEPVILVAEDDDSNYKYIEIILKKASYKVIRATNGFESVDICRNNPEICVLLTDLKMPGMDGFESTRLIRTFLPDLPIIVLSAYLNSSGENEAKSAGCTEYLVKPVNKIKLVETINAVLK